jgi:hypothetical protein
MEKRDKTSRRDKILQHGKSGVKEIGQNVSGDFCHNPGKTGWSFCHSDITSTPEAGWT